MVKFCLIFSIFFNLCHGLVTAREKDVKDKVVRIADKLLTKQDKERIDLIKNIFHERGYEGAFDILKGDASKTQNPQEGDAPEKPKTEQQKKLFEQVNPDKTEHYTLLISQFVKEIPGHVKEFYYMRTAHPTMDVNIKNKDNKALIKEPFYDIVKDMFDLVQSTTSPTAFVRFYTKNTWYRAYIMRVDGYLSSYTVPTIVILLMGIDLDIIENEIVKFKLPIDLKARDETTTGSKKETQA